ncbi:tyrosine protein kinase [Anditalea andensis]|uniref:Tyrosine protein kinase n=1 Tax=Anditalea andensis TaxID=1048983 RepID=A0A074KTU9_9BACT|nr:tyrosine protein kinase [Anditalea andensis]
MEDIDLSKFEEESKPIDIKYYITKYFRYWPLYLICIILALIMMFLFHRYTVEEYQVKGSILIKKSLSPEVRIFDRSNFFTDNNNLENDVFLFSSKNLAAEALKRLHFDVSYYADTHIKQIELYDKSPVLIDVDWAFPQRMTGLVQLTILTSETYILSAPEQKITDYVFKSSFQLNRDDGIFGKVYRFGDMVESSKVKFIAHLLNPDQVGDQIEFQINDPYRLIQHYANLITVKPLNSFGSVLEVSMPTTVVEKGRDYVNALMDAFLEYDLYEKNRISENALQFIDEQLFIIEDSLKMVERRLQNFRVANKLLDVDKEYSGLLTKIEGLSETVRLFDYEIAYYTSLRDYLLHKGNDYAEVMAPSLVGISDQLLNGMVQNLVQLSLERRKLLSMVKENHPYVHKLDLQIAHIKQNIIENIENLVFNTENKKQDTYEKLTAFDNQFTNLPKAESDYTHIFREFKLRENLYTYLLEKRAEAGIAKASNVSDNLIVDYAKEGDHIYPNRRKNYSMAVGMGFFVPFLFLIIYHYLNNKIVDQIQLKSTIRLPLLSTIGFNTKKTDLLVAEHPKSMVSESIRSLRSALFYIASERKCKCILVTSSVAGEGKSFVSINLATAMALSGKKTCIIGMDMRKPKVCKVLNVSNKVGLSSFLVGTTVEDDIVLPTRYDNLYVIPSGPIPPNPSELLLKDSLTAFMNKLKSDFDVLIMDTPPVGLVSETMDLLRFSDVNLYIVRQHYTHKKHLLMINDLYRHHHVSDFYAIFNGFKGGGDIYDYSGYNYGYGYNYSYTKDSKYSGEYYEDHDLQHHRVFKKWIDSITKRSKF